MKNSTKDMTIGSPLRLIIGFAVPMLLGILFQQLYNMVDAMVVGKWIGTEALAGVGSTSSINFMIVGFCTGLGTGFAIPVSQSFGAKDFSSLRRFVANTIWVSVFLISILTVVVSVFCRDILVLMLTPNDILNYAYDYILIIFIGLPVLYAYNLLAAVIRALGDSKSPVFFLIISAGLNIILDIISVGIFKMGVRGPAIATVISQSVSVILCFIYIRKKFDILKIRKEEWHPNFRKILSLISMGLPMGLQYSITAIGSVVFQTSVNALGTTAVAVVAAAQKVGSLFACPYEALGGTMATYAGQNTGIGSTKRIHKGMICAIIIGACYGLAAFIILFFFGDKISLLYLDAKEAEIIKNAHMYLIFHSASYVLLNLVNNLRFTIQGITCYFCRCA